MSASAAMTAEVDNPFRPGGELSEEAEGILRHSTISRDLVVIRDPASRETSTIEAGHTSISGTENGVEEGEVKAEKAQAVHFSPKGNKDGVVSGVVEAKTVGPDASGDRAEDEVKTERITAQDPTSPTEVEHVQLKKKKGCCVMC